MNSTNIQKETFSIDKKMRQELHSHSSCILWFTGLSGSGKSTLAREVESALFSRKISTYILDGDNMRFGLNKDLGFSKEDREENIRRIGEVSKLFVDSGTIILSAFISPYQIDRNQVRELVNENEFIEIFVNCPLEVCEQRDSKGLYQKARSGEIKGFTGIDDPYEKPTNPEIEVNTSTSSIQECVDEIIEYLTSNNII